MSPALSRRRFLAGTTAALAPALAGCGAWGAAADDPHTLVVHSQLAGIAPGAPTFRSVIREFERSHRGVTVRHVTNGDDLSQVYETARLAGKEADIAMVNLYDKTLAWTDVQATVPVGGYLDDWGLRDRVLPAALQEWTDGDGRLRAFPYFGTNWPVAFNLDLLREAGIEEPPTSVDGLIDAADALRGQGRTPVAIGGNDWTGQKLLAQIIQTYLPRADAARLFTSGDFGEAGAMRGIELFTQLRDAGVFADNAQGLTSDSMTTQYNSGRAAAESAMSSALAKVPKRTAAVTRVGGWPVPGDAAHDRPTVLRAHTVCGLWVSPNGRRKLPLVEKFVRFLYRPEVISRFVTEAGRDMSVRTKTLSTDFPLVAKAQRLSDNDVSQVLLPDLYVPATATTALIQATSTAFRPGTGARAISRALQSAYRGR